MASAVSGCSWNFFGILFFFKIRIELSFKLMYNMTPIGYPVLPQGGGQWLCATVYTCAKFHHSTPTRSWVIGQRTDIQDDRKKDSGEHLISHNRWRWNSFSVLGSGPNICIQYSTNIHRIYAQNRSSSSSGSMYEETKIKVTGHKYIRGMQYCTLEMLKLV